MAKRRSRNSSPTTNAAPFSSSRRNDRSRTGLQNLLLAALPGDERDRIVATLEVVPLILKDLLYKPAEHIQYVYFPGGGFCSIVTVLEDGSMVEVATVGREGMVGLTAADGVNMDLSATMVQGENDTCYRMPADTFRQEMDRRGAFCELLSRYGRALMGFIMQSTACNAVHSVEQRLARWLLMAHDRMQDHEFPLTQEFVAMMLGATRPTVTVVAGTLQKAGLITYHRGRITILDRARLESASCECYRVTARLLAAVTSA
jgi:CRP-like cAMP-binding protein